MKVFRIITSLERVCRSLVRDTSGDEVRVADSLDLVHSILVNKEVKERVEAVQEHHDLDSIERRISF